MGVIVLIFEEVGVVKGKIVFLNIVGVCVIRVMRRGIVVGIVMIWGVVVGVDIERILSRDCVYMYFV